MSARAESEQHARAQLEALGEDLGSLVADLECRPIQIEAVSGLVAPKHRGAAFRLHFEDGRSLKGRRLRDEATADRVEWVLKTVSHPALPEVIARRGRGLLLEWIEGRPLPDGGLMELRACAAIQASLHTFPLPADSPFVPPDVVARQRASSARHLQQLVDANLIQRSEASTLRDMLEVHEPAVCEVGFIHGDLCAENAILDRLGRVRLIDNEAVAIGPCDGDLARTLYRWAMQTGEMRAYLDAYAEKRAVESFLAGFPFWAIAARLGSAAHRIGAPSRVAEAPLQSLRSFVHTLEIETSPMQRVLDTSNGEPHGG